nr:galactosidase like protein [Ipomoea batatas]
MGKEDCFSLVPFTIPEAHPRCGKMLLTKLKKEDWTWLKPMCSGMSMSLPLAIMILKGGMTW